MFAKQVEDAVQTAYEIMTAVVAQKVIKDQSIDPDNWLPVSRITHEEFYGQAGYQLQQQVRFTPEQASEIFKAYPELLSMKQPKAYMALEDTLQNSLMTVLLNSKYDELKKMSLDLYKDMTLDDVVDIFDRAVALRDKLPEQTLFRETDPDPDLLDFFADRFSSDNSREVKWVGEGYVNEKNLIAEAVDGLDRWIRVLSGRTLEAKAMARELKEAKQLLIFVKDGDMTMDDIRPTAGGLKL
jgi:hypothetical protein